MVISYLMILVQVMQYKMHVLTVQMKQCLSKAVVISSFLIMGGGTIISDSRGLHINELI